ncbi:MAG: oligosaccharide flippase family protein [Candidatus Zixiibacteriota bacterium]|nr:MAG: oligosaccharide flippase family protein [candidate division Zixibacteria bacterium]
MRQFCFTRARFENSCHFHSGPHYIIKIMAGIVRQFGKNVFTSWTSLAVRIILVFLVNPFIIHTLGDDRYGVWVLVVSIINYMTILDLGLKQALIRFISKFLGLGDFDRINSILNTAFVIYMAVGLVVVAVTILLSFTALGWFSIPEHLLSQARLALIIVGATAALNFILLCWGDSLGAFHRYDVSYGLMIFEDILRTTAIVILLKNGGGLVPFALVFLAFGLLRLISGAIALKKLFPKIKLKFGGTDKEAFKLLWGYGLYSFLVSVAWLLISNTDNVLIGYFLDTSAVTKYAIAAGFIVYLRSAVLAVSFPLRPVISHYDALDKIENIRFIYTQGTKYIYFVTFLIGGGTIFFADSLIHLWMGPGYEQTALILKILVIPAAVFLPQLVASSVLFGTEKHRYLLYIIIIEGIINLVLSVILVRYYGLLGIAYGTVIPQVLVYLIIVPRVIRTVLGFNLWRYYRFIFTSAAPAFAFAAALSYTLKTILPPDNWGIFIGETAAVAILSILSARWIFDREELKSVLERFFARP